MQKRTAASAVEHGAPQKKVKFDPLHAGHLAPDNATTGRSRPQASRGAGSSDGDGDERSFAGEEEALMEQDVGLGAASTARKRVNTDGYDSDSSLSEDELDGASRRGKGRTDKAPTLDSEAGPADEDVDMFGEPPSAALVEDDARAPARASRKNGKSGTRAGGKDDFLEMDDIEGQDFSTEREYMDIVDEDVEDDVDAEFQSHGVSAERRQGHTSGALSRDQNGHDGDDEDDDDDDEIDDEVGALGRKRNAPKLDSFNMRAEMEEGAFDEDGNYIRASKDKRDSQDDWLNDVSRKDMERAREAQRAQAEARQRQQDAAGGGLAADASVGDMLAELIGFLQTGETLLEALQRHGGGKSGVRTGPRRRRDKQSATSEGASKDSSEKRRIERISAIADRLMTRTELEVYDSERERLIRQYKAITGREYHEAGSFESNGRANGDDEDDMFAAAPASEKQWEFFWAGAEESINGPYSQNEMRDWAREGYFQQSQAYARALDVGESADWTLIAPGTAIFDT